MIPVLALGVAIARAAQSGQRAVFGFCFGLGWFLSGIWWLYISMQIYGGMPWALAVLGLVAFCAYLALFPALGFAVGSSPLRFAGAFCLAEWLRAWLFTGFGWAQPAYAHTDSGFAFLAPWIGADGINFLLAGAAAWLASVRGWPKRGIATVAVVAFALVPPAALLRALDQSQSAGRFSVALLQTNIAQEEKFASERLMENLRDTQQLLASARADLLLTPETALPIVIREDSEFILERWLSKPLSEGSTVLLGLPLSPKRGEYTNSAQAFAPKLDDSARYKAVYQYDKHHLVPFGEFVPWGFSWFVRMMQMPLGDFNRGDLSQPSFALGAQRIAPTICYEDVFGEELRPRFADAASAPTVFANLTNIAWFGNTIAVDQHLAIARIRSIEFARPTVRATNTGATVAIDHLGVVQARLAPYTRAVLNAEVEGRRGLTIYARFGSWPVLALSCLILVVGFIKSRSRQ